MKHIYSLEAFADFTGKKDPDEEYDFGDAARCACGQYAKEIGYPDADGGYTWLMDALDKPNGFFSTTNDIAAVSPVPSAHCTAAFVKQWRRGDELLA